MSLQQLLLIGQEGTVNTRLLKISGFQAIMKNLGMTFFVFGKGWKIVMASRNKEVSIKFFMSFIQSQQ